MGRPDRLVASPRSTRKWLAQSSYTPYTRTDDGTTDCARVDRTVNGRPRIGCGESEDRRQCGGPADVLVTSAGWDGERAHLAAALDVRINKIPA